MRDAVYALLSTDPTLMGILTGGLYDGRETGEISRSGTPEAFDSNGEIQPCGLLRFTTDAPYGPYETSARVYFSILLYERSGYASVEAARTRLYSLLHRAKVTPSAGSCWRIDHAGDVLDARDQVLGCSLVISRFVGVIGK